MDEAVRLVNGTRYGLGAAVYGGRRAGEIARRLNTGMVSVNTVFATAQLATVPFGGVGESGFGRIHGAEGLREFASPQSVVRQRFRPLLALTTFDRTAKAEETARQGRGARPRQALRPGPATSRPPGAGGRGRQHPRGRGTAGVLIRVGRRARDSGRSVGTVLGWRLPLPLRRDPATTAGTAPTCGPCGGDAWNWTT